MRNLFDTTQAIPALCPRQYLLVEDTLDGGRPLAAGVQRMTCTGLHQITPYRCLSVLQAPPQPLPANALCHRAITARQGPLHQE